MLSRRPRRAAAAGSRWSCCRCSALLAGAGIAVGAAAGARRRPARAPRRRPPSSADTGSIVLDADDYIGRPGGRGRRAADRAGPGRRAPRGGHRGRRVPDRVTAVEPDGTSLAPGDTVVVTYAVAPGGDGAASDGRRHRRRSVDAWPTIRPPPRPVPRRPRPPSPAPPPAPPSADDCAVVHDAAGHDVGDRTDVRRPRRRPTTTSDGDRPPRRRPPPRRRSTATSDVRLRPAEPAPSRSGLAARPDPERGAEGTQGGGEQEAAVAGDDGQHDEQPEDGEADQAAGGDPPGRARRASRLPAGSARRAGPAAQHATADRGERRPQRDDRPVGLAVEVAASGPARSRTSEQHGQAEADEGGRGPAGAATPGLPASRAVGGAVALEGLRPDRAAGAGRDRRRRAATGGAGDAAARPEPTAAGGGVPRPGRPGTKSTGPVGCGRHRRPEPVRADGGGPGVRRQLLVAGGGRRAGPPGSPAWSAVRHRRAPRAAGVGRRTHGSSLRAPVVRGSDLSVRTVTAGRGPGGSPTAPVAERARRPGAPRRRRPRVGRVGTRAGIVVTGTEVLTGRVADRNGPWLAEQLRAARRRRRARRRRGRPARRPARRPGVPRRHRRRPRHHHRRARPDGRRPHRRGGGRRSRAARRRSTRRSSSGSRTVVERLMARRGWRADPDGHGGRRPQAGAGPRRAPRCSSRSAPRPGSSSRRRRAGTGPTVLVLPGPPAELRACGRRRSPPEPVRRALAGAPELRQETVRLWGTLEAQLAVTLREHERRAGRPGDHHLHARRRAGDRHPLRARTPSPPTTGCVAVLAARHGRHALLHRARRSTTSSAPRSPTGA